MQICSKICQEKLADAIVWRRKEVYLLYNLRNIEILSGEPGLGWTESEIGHLSSAFFQISEDASYVTGQKADSF